ncbi:MAG: DUF2007 domain-containing protein [Acidimicrobiales bacterium]
MESLRMVPLASTASSFEAKVLVARLGSEGVVWELRGLVDTVYPFGGPVDVLVAEPDLDRAREVLSLCGLGGSGGVGGGDAVDATAATTSPGEWLAGALLVLVVLGFLVARLLAL